MKGVCNLPHKMKRSPLTMRAIGYVTLFSALFTLFTSVTQLAFEYQREIYLTNLRFQQIEDSYSPSLAQSIWQHDNQGIELQLKGILGFQDIEQVTLVNLDDQDYKIGRSIRSEDQIIHAIELKHPGRKKLLGELVIKVNKNNIYTRLKRKALFILFSHGSLIFLLALLISFIFQRLITNHLSNLSKQAREFTLSDSAPPIKLDKHQGSKLDEIDRLALTLNSLHASLVEDSKKRLIAEEILRRKEEQYRRLIEDLKDEYVFYTRTPRGIFTYVSPSISNVLGYTQEEFLTHYTNFLTDHPLNKSSLQQNQVDYMDGSTQPFELEMYAKNGAKHLTLVQEHPVFDENGAVIAVDGLSRDITEASQQKNELVRSETRYAIALEASGAGVFEYNVPVTDDVYFSSRWCEIFGYSKSEVPQERNFIHWWYKRIYARDRSAMKAAYEAFLDGKTQVFDHEIRVRHKSGNSRYIHVLARAISRNSEGRTTAIAGAIMDISERKRYEDRLLKQANYDTLTGLPNRALAIDRLSQAIREAKREKTRVAIMFIDLDHFKNVNDTLGHASGDLLLIEAAKRIKQCIRANSTVSRLGGDEFLIITPNLKRTSYCERVAQRVLTTLTDAFTLDTKNVFVAASIGIAIYPNDGENEHQLLKHADAAMYRAKENGRSTYQFFTEAINKKCAERNHLALELKQAIEKQQLKLFYQPIVDIKNNQIVGTEALLRWQHPEKGLLKPEEFISLAEDSTLIIELDQWMLKSTSKQLEQWDKEGWQSLALHINISDQLIKSPNFLEELSELFTQRGIALHRLMLEVKESLVLNSSDETLNILQALTQAGFKLAIDNFGTGYSSLNYLRSYPFSCLKVDASLTQEIPNNIPEAKLTESIILMAQGLGLEVIGEGIESRQQLDFYSQSECKRVQGFYFSNPIPAEDFSQLLADQKALSAITSESHPTDPP